MIATILAATALNAADAPRFIDPPASGPARVCMRRHETHPRWSYSTVGVASDLSEFQWLVQSPHTGDVWIDADEMITGSRETGVVFVRHGGRFWRVNVRERSAAMLDARPQGALQVRGHGVAISQMAGRGNRLEVADLDSDSVTRFDAGVRFTQVMSGWSFDHDAPVVIVASQHGRADEGAHHQADVFSLDGEPLAQVRSDDLETLWRPYHSNGAVLALSRPDEWLCPVWVGQDGVGAPAAECSRDMSDVWLDAEGQIVDMQAYHLNSDASAGAVHGWPMAGFAGAADVAMDGSRAEWILTDGLPRLTFHSVDGEGAIPVNSPCSVNPPVRIGREITASSSDGLTVHGFLHLPEGEPKALVVTLHGGPYAASSRHDSFHADRLVPYGYAVLDTNVRGSLGYGRAYMEAGFGLTLDAQADDAEALAAAALAEWPDREIPVILSGESWGGMPAITAASKRDTPFDALVLAVATCRFPTVPGLGRLPGPEAGVTPNNPAFARLLWRYSSEIGADDDLCGVALNPDLPVLSIIAGREDRIPYGTINALKEANPDTPWTEWQLPNAGHTLPNYIHGPMFSERLDELLESLR
ncbi:prolyl oligopeptidase family serine peptidase [Glycocaulis profundi]|nr:prolyl oligopeptidase family serine peptidase [Glycocaulis profundi]